MDGQPLGIAVENFQDPQPGEVACTTCADRATLLTLLIRNMGTAAVTLPSVLDLVPFYTNGTNATALLQTTTDTDVAPNTFTTAKYVITLYGPQCVLTHIEVSVNASNGSGSVTLPIGDKVPGPD